MEKKKTIKAWAVVSPTELYWHEERPMIYPTKNMARFHKYEGSILVPCTITYSLPSKTPKKKL